MKQLTKEEAIRLAKNKEWEKWPDKVLVGFQLFQDKLCVDFSAFHAAIERVLERPVFTHEFGLNIDGLIAEFLGKSSAPSLEDVMDMIPKDKKVILIGKGGEEDG